MKQIGYAIVALLVITATCSAQGLIEPLGMAGGTMVSEIPAPYESDVINARPVRYFLGIPFGPYFFQHLGEYSPSCDCVFRTASDVDIVAGLEFSVYYPKLGFAVKAMAGYWDYSATFTQRQTRTTVISGSTLDTLIDYEKVSHVKLKYLTFTPTYAWYFPYSSVYLEGGIEIGIPLKARYDNIEKIITPGFVYPVDSTNTTTLLRERDIERDGKGKLRLGFHVGAGVDIRLSDRFYLAPQCGVSLPLTSVSSSDKTWKVLNEYVAVLLKIRL